MLRSERIIRRVGPADVYREFGRVVDLEPVGELAGLVRILEPHGVRRHQLVELERNAGGRGGLGRRGRCIRHIEGENESDAQVPMLELQ
jgi:hypothetical protein